LHSNAIFQAFLRIINNKLPAFIRLHLVWKLIREKLERVNITSGHNLARFRVEKEITSLVVSRVANKNVVFCCKPFPYMLLCPGHD
jgi:hypothetical protein